MALSAALKARLERLYCEGTVPYADLVKLSRLNRFGFQKLVEQEGWGARPKASSQPRKVAGGKSASADAPPGTAEDGADGAAAQPKADKRKKAPGLEISLVQKIYSTIWSELAKLDQQSGSKSQDRERASRALSQLVSSMEKAVSMQKAIERDKTREAKPKDREALANADDLRRKIAERLERLHSQRLAAK